MSYVNEVDERTPVGSYDTDSLTELSPKATGDDQVRCVCGCVDENGTMVQCEVRDSQHYQNNIL